MNMFLAQFVSTEPTQIEFTAVADTAGKAIRAVRGLLMRFLDDMDDGQVEIIVETGVVPEQLDYDQLERDVRAVLYGSDDLRPHITVRTLPPRA